MTRVLLHPGFHKTGTKSVQQFLSANAPLIWPHAALILPARIRAITQLAFACTRNPAPEILALLGDEMRRFLGTLSLARKGGKPPRDIIISAENLLGPMPRGDGPVYPQAQAILTALTAALRDTVAATQVTVYLSLRDQQDWARSVHAHHARRLTGLRLTDDVDKMHAALGRFPLAERAALAVPGATVMTADIATLSPQPFGIAQPFVDFLRLPPDALRQLVPVQYLHRTDPALTDEVMALNRSTLDDAAWEQAKRALLNPKVRA